MTFRVLIIGIAIWLPATIFASASWSQSQTDYFSGFSIKHLTRELPDGLKFYDAAIKRLPSETERLAIKDILAELDKKSNREILALKLAPDVCQEIACRGARPQTVNQFLASYAEMRFADDVYQTAQRNEFIAAVSAFVSLLSLLISAQIRNPTTRRAYARAAEEFFDWLAARSAPTAWKPPQQRKGFPSTAMLCAALSSASWRTAARPEGNSASNATWI